MINPLSVVENIFYKLRSFIWRYPDFVWVREDSIANTFKAAYRMSQPYSHFVISFLLCLGFIAYLLNIPNLKVLAQPSNRFIEGVVVGVDQDGEIQSLSKVNPLYPTLVQLERDINELIYEPLIVVEQDGSVTPILAEEITVIQAGADYEFKLREDVFWHDSNSIQTRKFGINDVLQTLDIISQIETPEGLEISYVQAVKQMAWERVGEDAIRICTTTPQLQQQLPPDLANKKCSGVREDKPILANFLELISFKIMPAHLTVGLSGRNIMLPDPAINKRPIGTGKYKFGSVKKESITLTRNSGYYGEVPQIEHLEFRLFKDKSSAFRALQNGEIHALSTTATDSIREMAGYSQVETLLSPVQSNQYWGMYFNLRKDLDGNPVGPEFFQRIRVRRAISSAIDRERILRSLLGIGEEAIGPIYKQSEYFNPSAPWETYNPERAVQLLEADGWMLDPNLGLRKKDNVILSFKLSFVDTPDRVKVVDSIRQDLLQVGIEVVPDPWPLEDLFAQVVSPKLFDALLYGMNTFIDPDRYELFHSEQSLNLSSYAGLDITVDIKDNDTAEVPRVDKLLARARSFDPIGDKDERRKDYLYVQRLIAEDTPVVFLYHPQFIYYVSGRVKDLDLKRAYSVEQRFVGIEKWRIEN